MRVLRTIFVPWEEHPGMLTAYFRARAAPGFDMYTRVRLVRRPWRDCTRMSIDAGQGRIRR